MNDFVAIPNIAEVFVGRRRLPTTMMWNRLEGRPRTTDFSRALQAEVRDPLWLITRQFQMGEFIGDDAGSPVVAKAAWRSDAVAHVHARDGTPVPYDAAVPLEAMVEARPVPLTLAGRLHNADLRLALGRRWTRLLQDNGHGGLVSAFASAHAFVAPDPAAPADYPLTASAANWQMLSAIAGRAIDGGSLLLALVAGGMASDGLGLIDPERTAIDTLGAQFRAWAEALYFQPDAALASWDPRHLEYGLGLSAPHADRAAALDASDYRGGRLDWFHFDAVPPAGEDTPDPAPAAQATSFMPTTIQFDGMPNTRYWAFEEGRTSFGDIKPDTTDIAKLLLIEFGLVFANDWFLLPITLPVGSLTEIRGLSVTNCFGERTWIEPAVSADGPVSSWQMFRLTGRDSARDGRLFLPATTPTGLESAPVEAVDMVRDEVSNMVWGVERTVQLASGASRRAREVALELHARYQADVVPAPPAGANDATIRYTLMTSVAEHWIPFIPVHIDNDNREIQLQRAAMPRLLDGAQGVVPQKIQPRTALLREGLEASPPAGYFVAEEEVERAGTVIESRWQRCRWTNGEVITWLGNRRTVGRNAQPSGLAFDVLTAKAPK